MQRKLTLSALRPLAIRFRVISYAAAANGGSEPILPIFCNAAKVHFRKTGGIALKITAETGP